MTSVGKVNQAPSLLLLLRQGLALEPACFQSAQLWVAEPNPNGSQPCPCGSAPRVPHPARCPSQEPQPSAFGLAWGRKEWCKCNTASGKSCWGGLGLTSSGRARARQDLTELTADQQCSVLSVLQITKSKDC